MAIKLHKYAYHYKRLYMMTIFKRLILVTFDNGVLLKVSFFCYERVRALYRARFACKV